VPCHRNDKPQSYSVATFLLHAVSHVYVRAVTGAHSNCCLNPRYAPNWMIIFINTIPGWNFSRLFASYVYNTTQIHQLLSPITARARVCVC